MGLIVRILDGFCRWSRCCWVGDCWGEMKVYESHFSEKSILTDFFLFSPLFFLMFLGKFGEQCYPSLYLKVPTPSLFENRRVCLGCLFVVDTVCLLTKSASLTTSPCDGELVANSPLYSALHHREKGQSNRW